MRRRNSKNQYLFAAVAFVPVIIGIALIFGLAFQRIPGPIAILGLGGPSRNHLPEAGNAPHSQIRSATSGAITHRPVSSGAPSTVLFSDNFSGGDGLITNEYATYNGGDHCARVSGKWELNSGSLFRRSAEGYSGRPDSDVPDCASAGSTDSDVFRALTKSAFGDSTLSFDFTLLSHHPGNPDDSWDGVHAFLRYQSQYALYYVSVGRWDGNIVIKKKVPGGSDNGGTYYELTDYLPRPTLNSPGRAHHVLITAQNQSNGSVKISLVQDGVVVASAVDTGVGGPVYHFGADGIRGDYTEFEFDNFVVKAL